jgi:hypothetical protein
VDAREEVMRCIAFLLDFGAIRALSKKIRVWSTDMADKVNALIDGRNNEDPIWRKTK